jgi:hypothetical protein
VDDVERFIEVPVVLGAVEGAPPRVAWHFNDRPAAPKSIMKNITAQTGLTATQVERKIKVLTIKKAQ